RSKAESSHGPLTMLLLTAHSTFQRQAIMATSMTAPPARGKETLRMGGRWSLYPPLRVTRFMTSATATSRTASSKPAHRLCYIGLTHLAAQVMTTTSFYSTQI